MAIEFRLILTGDLPAREVAEVVAPGAAEGRTASGSPMLSSRFDDALGYGVDIIAGHHGYYDAEDEDGSLWVWEPDRYLQVDFAMGKDALAERGIPAMLRGVSAVLDHRPEDAALVLNANWLLLTRVGGTVRKHRQSWWQHHDLPL
ncbi:hypothetical protein AWW66_09135 [Micromonospora rosaria]|uniref:Uncharacterized protein n=1 Tax=Micromonospora rosaria TaxID=47874 RepID=A0A136PUV7_9ACTN|nr:SitI3 family protein [Micromonospora rosaria]KXK62291.1 hypothetical protein AWW66_09135 [Micromonospora rosaria]